MRRPKLKIVMVVHSKQADTQVRIYLMKRAGMLHRVSPKHYALSQPTQTVLSAFLPSASSSGTLQSAKKESL
jgi:hypothetical protein